MSSKSIPVTVSAASAQWGADTYQLDSGQPSVQVSPADAERRSVTIYNDANSAGIIYVTPNGGTKSGGIRLIPGAGYEFTTGAPIYARAVGGDAVVNVVAESGWTC